MPWDYFWHLLLLVVLCFFLPLELIRFSIVCTDALFKSITGDIASSVVLNTHLNLNDLLPREVALKKIREEAKIFQNQKPSLAVVLLMRLQNSQLKNWKDIRRQLERLLTQNNIRSL